MIGNSGRGLVIQARDRRLLEELAAMRVMDREQTKLAAGFGSTSRANARLLALTQAGLLRRFFLGSARAGRKALYCLSAKGAHVIGAAMRGIRRKQGVLLATDFFVEHQLAVNEIYCALKFRSLPSGTAFCRWVPFFVPVANTRLIPDGYVELTTPSGVVSAFVEVDLGNESLSIWKQKVTQYLDYAVSGAYESHFGRTAFRVIIVVNGARRLHSMRDAAAGITHKLFWFAEGGAIRTNGLFASVWYRASNDVRHPSPLLPS